MRWMQTLTLRLRSLFRRARVEDDLDSELRFHLEQIEENLAARGTPQDRNLAGMYS